MYGEGNTAVIPGKMVQFRTPVGSQGRKSENWRETDREKRVR
jgi:hypothetical protein